MKEGLLLKNTGKTILKVKNCWAGEIAQRLRLLLLKAVSVGLILGSAYGPWRFSRSGMSTESGVSMHVCFSPGFRATDILVYNWSP